MVLVRFIVIGLCLGILLGCTTKPLVIEINPDITTKIAAPEKLKLVEGIYAVYDQGSLLIDVFYTKPISGDSFLRQIYGKQKPRNSNIATQKKIAQRDAKEIKDLSNSGYVAYLINHVAATNYYNSPRKQKTIS